MRKASRIAAVATTDRHASSTPAAAAPQSLCDPFLTCPEYRGRERDAGGAGYP